MLNYYYCYYYYYLSNYYLVPKKCLNTIVEKSYESRDKSIVKGRKQQEKQQKLKEKKEKEEKEDYKDSAMNINEVLSPMNRLKSYKGMLSTTYLFVILNLLFIRYYQKKRNARQQINPTFKRL